MTLSDASIHNDCFTSIPSNEIVRQILDQCITAIDIFSKQLLVEALILTGSFSRGEGSILFGDSGVANVLGDMEFYVVLGESANHASVQTQLSMLAQTVERELCEQQINCKVEFSPVARNYFRRVRPSIFNYELFKNGKVVFGDKNLLQEIPPFGPDSIPPEDGFYLLSNRMVEQLIAVTSMRDNSSDIRYQILKLYLDMAGSYLVVSGRYAPTYAERAGLCSAAMPTDKIIASSARRQLFLETLDKATAYKLNPNIADCPLMSEENLPEQFWKLFQEAASYCRDIWQWELHQLFGASENGAGWTVLANRRFKILFIIREWLKFFIMTHRAGQKFSVWRAIRQCTKGTPRTLIYAAAAHLYFGLAEGKKIDTRTIERLLPVSCRLNSTDEAIDAVIDSWDKFVRSA
jgi:hypothetical protein